MAQYRLNIYQQILAATLLICVMVLAGCGGGGGAAALNLPPQPLRDQPAGWFDTVTKDYSALYNTPLLDNSAKMSDPPFPLGVQFQSSMYPIPVSYEETVPAPTGFGTLQNESEAAIKRWAKADPRISVISGVSVGSQDIDVQLVNAISYNGLNNIIGLTQLTRGVSDPQYLVSIAVIDPLNNQPMSAADVRKTLTHELGHAFGLGHSVDNRDVMYYKSTSNQGSTDSTYLTLGDALAIWSTLDARGVSWLPARPAVTISRAVPNVTTYPTGRAVYRTSDKDGTVVCVYTRP